MSVETFTFEDEKARLQERDLNERFFAYYKKMDTSKTFILLFVRQKGRALFFSLKEVNPSPDRKMIKLLTFDNLFPPLLHSRQNS